MSSPPVCSPVPGSEEGFYDFDPEGDLILILTALPGDGLPGQTEEIRCRVSSKHLSLVSPVFRAMLQRQFKEATTLRSIGKADIPLADDNPVVFMILLEIIHGCTRSIPRAITLDMLTEAAVLVDKYDCKEVVEQYSDMWICGLRGKMPLTLEVALRWLCIAWVFRKPTEFKHATEIAIRSETLGEMMDGLPVPSSVLDAIERARQRALASIISMLHSLLELYQGNTMQCPRGAFWGLRCDAMVLGGLMKGLQSIGIFPLPEAPYKDLSFNGLAVKVCSMQFPSLCDGDPNGLYGRCGVGERIKSLVSGLDNQLFGLDLEFLRREKKLPRNQVMRRDLYFWNVTQRREG